MASDNEYSNMTSENSGTVYIDLNAGFGIGFTCQICGNPQELPPGETHVGLAICDRCKKVFLELVQNHKSNWGRHE